MAKKETAAKPAKKTAKPSDQESRLQLIENDVKTLKELVDILFSHRDKVERTNEFHQKSIVLFTGWVNKLTAEQPEAVAILENTSELLETYFKMADRYRDGEITELTEEIFLRELNLTDEHIARFLESFPKGMESIEVPGLATTEHLLGDNIKKALDACLSTNINVLVSQIQSAAPQLHAQEIRHTLNLFVEDPVTNKLSEDMLKAILKDEYTSSYPIAG